MQMKVVYKPKQWRIWYILSLYKAQNQLQLNSTETNGFLRTSKLHKQINSSSEIQINIHVYYMY